MNVLNLPTAEQFDEQIAVLREISGKMGLMDTISTWTDVQSIVRRGQAERYFRIGDLLMSSYDGKPTVWVVIGINHDAEHSLTIQTQDCVDKVQFSNYQALYYAEQEVPPGKQVFEIDSGKYEFVTSVALPEGGQFYASGWENYVPKVVSLYDADRTTVLQSGIPIVESTDTVNLSPVNHQQRCWYGSNNYVESAIRQWLNSDAQNFVWQPQTNFDRPSTSAVYKKGFLARLNPELVAVLGTVEKRVARNTVTDNGGQDVFEDKVFLLSRVEVGLGTEGDTTGEVVYPYYDGVTNADRIKLLGTSPRSWWLRSPWLSRASHAWYVYPSGAVDRQSHAYNAYGAAPACTII